MKTVKLSKVEIGRLKTQIKKLHVDSETGELDIAEEEVVTQSYENVLLQEFTDGAGGYVEDAGVIFFSVIIRLHKSKIKQKYIQQSPNHNILCCRGKLKS